MYFNDMNIIGKISMENILRVTVNCHLVKFSLEYCLYFLMIKSVLNFISK